MLAVRGSSTLGLLRQAASSPLLPGKHRLVGKAGICKFLRREPRPIQGPFGSKLKLDLTVTYPLSPFFNTANCARGPQIVAHLVLTIKAFATQRAQKMAEARGLQSLPSFSFKLNW